MFRKPAPGAGLRPVCAHVTSILLVALWLPGSVPAGEAERSNSGNMPLVLATGARGATPAAVVRVRDDYGGSIAAYMARVDSVNARRQRVEITGDCRSACTLYLGALDLCVSGAAVLRFHGPSGSRQPLTERQFDEFSRRMAGYYPGPVRDWFLESARYETNGTVALSGATLIRLGVPEC